MFKNLNVKDLFTPGSMLLIVMFILSTIIWLFSSDTYHDAPMLFTLIGAAAWGMLRYLTPPKL